MQGKESDMDKILRIDMGAEGGPKATEGPVGGYAGFGGRALTSAVFQRKCLLFFIPWELKTSWSLLRVCLAEQQPLCPAVCPSAARVPLRAA